MNLMTYKEDKKNRKQKLSPKGTMTSTFKERKSLSADPPLQWKPDFKPRDYPDYLDHVEQTALQSTEKYIQEAIQALVTTAPK